MEVCFYYFSKLNIKKNRKRDKTLKNKFKYVFATLSLLSLATSTFITPTVAKAAENQDYSVDYEIVKNDLYLQFEEELTELVASNQSTPSALNSFSKQSIAPVLNQDNSISEEQLFYLVEKYDGAELTAIVNAKSVYTSKFVKGGINSYATSYQNLNILRSDLKTNATMLRIGGTLVGTVGGLVGTLVGAVTGDHLAGNCDDAAAGVSAFIQGGYTRGGARVTLTEGFPINNIDSIYEAVIK